MKFGENIMSIPLVLILAYVGVFAVTVAVVAAKVLSAKASADRGASLIGDTLIKNRASSRHCVAANESNPTSLAA